MTKKELMRLTAVVAVREQEKDTAEFLKLKNEQVTQWTKEQLEFQKSLNKKRMEILSAERQNFLKRNKVMTELRYKNFANTKKPIFGRFGDWWEDLRDRLEKVPDDAAPPYFLILQAP